VPTSWNNQIYLHSLPQPPLIQQIKDELSEVVQEMESHENENKHPSKEKQMSIGRKKFNMDPKKGNWNLPFFHALMKIKTHSRTLT
jgi:uncharacterized membrane protein